MTESINLYDNIDYCLEILYESIYNNSNDECYNFNTINKKDIIIDNIRKELNFNYSNVLSGKFKFMGLYNNRVHYKRDGNQHPCTVAIGFSNKKYNKNDMGRPELYNMAVMYMASELAFNEKVRNILLPIMSFDMDKSKILQIFPDIKKEFGKVYDDNNDNLYVIITEHYFKMHTLKEYLEENSKTLTVLQLKALLFQIYYALLKLSEQFNKFRHNNLNLDSIRVYIKQKSDDVYKVDDNTFILRDNEIEIKITDFDNSYFHGEFQKNNNPYILLNNLNIDNPYYDIHYITNLIYLFLKNSNSPNISEIFNHFKTFFNEIIPEKYRIDNFNNFKGLDQDKYNKNQEDNINSSSIIKKNIIFQEFIMNNIKEPIKTLTVKDSSINYINLKDLNKIKNKKPTQYYSMIKGSRKIALPGLSSEVSEYSEVSSVSMHGGAKRGSKGAKSGKKSHKAQETISATSFTITESARNTASAKSASVSARIVNPEVTSVSSVASDFGRKKGSKKGRHQSRESEKKSSSSSGSSSSSTNHKGSSSSSTGSSSTETEKHQSRHHKHKDMELNTRLNPNMQKQLNGIPEGYFDLAPEHMINGLQQDGMPSMSPMSQGMPQMGQMPQEGMMGMPQMGQMPQMAPPMPEYMKNIAMGGQQMGPQMGAMNGQLGVPMDNQMASFMGMQAPQMGGGRPMQKYKLVNDKFFF